MSEKMTFESALAELERIVAGLERGELPLEESVNQYKRAEMLRAFCAKKLEEAELAVTAVTGTPGAEKGTPFPTES